jgi:hypothetical protein
VQPGARCARAAPFAAQSTASRAPPHLPPPAAPLPTRRRT